MLEIVSGRQYPERVIPLIDLAKNSINIIVFVWQWYPSDPGAICQLFNQSIIRAANRGVAVKAIANFGDIITVLNNNHCQAKKLTIKKLVHSKLIIIDERYFIIGSHNFSQKSFEQNFEISVIIEDQSVLPAFKTYFENIWANS